MKWRKWAKEIVVFAGILFLILAWQSRNLIDSDGTVQIKNYSLVSLQGEVMPLLSEDNPTLVYFFAPWCQVCGLSIGNLDYLRDSEVKVVAVALDYQSVEDVRDFAVKHGVNAQILLGTQGLQNTFDIRAYPTYYLLNEQKIIVASSMGYSTALGLKLRTLIKL
jgi:thiol-disulfide isomerase/thioredoxin